LKWNINKADYIRKN